MAKPCDTNPRRAAIAARLAAAGPAPRPVFRSGVDIDACHFRSPPLGAPAPSSPRPATVGASSSRDGAEEGK